MKTLATLTLAFAIGTATLAIAPRARAQCPTDPDSIAIIQDGEVVGEIYRIDPDPDHYVEHWVLYPGYVYPDAESGVITELRPGYRTYRNLDDFYARVPFEKGSRYVKVDCLDGTTLPGR